MKMDDNILVPILAKIAATGNEGALRLAVQLFGVEPCPVCDYRKSKCQCNKTTESLNETR